MVDHISSQKAVRLGRNDAHRGYERVSMDQITALRVFIAIAEEGSFSGAAQALSMSKSAVSKYVSSLEDRLGAKLLNRTTRQVSLTDEGRIYLTRTVRVLDQLEEAAAEVGAMKSEPIGTLRVSSALSFGLRQVAPALPDLLSRYPRLTVDIDFSDRFVDLVDEGVDVAIRIGELPDSTLIARRLATAALILVASPGYLETKGQPERPADLAEHTCLLYRGRSGPRYWKLGAGADGGETIRVDGPLVANNGDALKAAALAGLGIARLPSFLLDDALAAGTLQEVLPEYRPQSLPVHAVYLPNRHLSAKVRYFVDFLAERFAGSVAS